MSLSVATTDWGLHVKRRRICLSDFNQTLIWSVRFSESVHSYELNENPFSESRVGPCGRTDGQADMTKLIVAFRNFANAPKTTYFSVIIHNFNEFNSLKIIPILTYHKESNLVN